MTEQTDLFPDLKMAAVDILMDADVCGGRVYTSLPKDAGSTARPWPIVLVRRIGGMPRNQRVLDRANLYIDVWANNQADAFDVANAARKALIDARGTWANDETFVTDAGCFTGPQDIPDPDTGRDRVNIGMFLTGRAYPIPDSSS